MKLSLLFALFYALSTGECANTGPPNVADDPLPSEVTTAIRKKIWSKPVTNNISPLSRSRGATYRATTKMGLVDGALMETCRKSQRYIAFFGMPFAKPPVGKLRFQSPLPAEPWEGVYDATFERPSCMQFNGPVNLESEDCLYINVYTPSVNATKSKPVMVFFHGGAFISGSSNFSVYTPDLFIENDVILVTFNYRLGALGFLSLQTPDIPGNAGLKDQRLALEWIRDNIKSFGGDPNSVTIFGESAGGASITYHILSKSSKGLFHRAITESGTAISPWAFTAAEDTVKAATDLAKKLWCPSSGQAMVDCLRRASPYKITELQEKSVTLTDVLTFKPITFVPTREPNVTGAFLTENPINILLSKNFNRVPTIIGFNSREGLLLLPVLKSIDPLNIAVGFLSFNLCAFFPQQAKSTLSKSEKNYINAALRKLYLNVKPVGTFNTLKMTDIITDVAFMVPIQFTASMLARGDQPVYNYLFSYDGEYGFYKKTLNIKDPGVCHGDELGYLFYNPGACYSMNGTSNAEAERVMKTMVTMWTNFAKTGNPTPNGSGLVKWPAQNADNFAFAEIGKDMEVESELGFGLDGRLKFWSKLIKDIITSNK